MAAEVKNPKSDYLVLRRVQHDGKLYAKGAKLPLTEAQAKPLLDKKFIAAIPAE